MNYIKPVCPECEADLQLVEMTTSARIIKLDENGAMTSEQEESKPVAQSIKFTCTKCESGKTYKYVIDEYGRFWLKSDYIAHADEDDEEDTDGE